MSDFRPFEARITDQAIEELHARLDATRWFEDVYEADWKCGVPLPYVQALCDHWRHRFDWRAVEQRINAVPNFVTDIDGLTIHFVHLRSQRPDAIPLLLLHGWPGSFLEFIDLWGPFADPPAGQPAFHVIVPSLPGYGFSTTRPGTSAQAVATIMATLMERLGYERYVVQGGDWGSMIGTEIARQVPDNVIGLHLNCVNGSTPLDPDVGALSAQERAWAAELTDYLNYPHFPLQIKRPASLCYGISDSPSGLAAWIGEKMYDYSDKDDDGRSFIAFDQMLATISLFWFTRCFATSLRLYYELGQNPPVERYVSVPTAGAIFPHEVAKLPRTWAEHHYNIVQWSVFERGGHFAALECPEVLIEDVRRFVSLLATAGE